MGLVDIHNLEELIGNVGLESRYISEGGKRGQQEGEGSLCTPATVERHITMPISYPDLGNHSVAISHVRMDSSCI